MREKCSLEENTSKELKVPKVTITANYKRATKATTRLFVQIAFEVCCTNLAARNMKQ